MKKERRTELLVGLFLIVAVGFAMFLIVKMGSRLFVRQYVVTAYFKDAAGLNPGVPVTLAGVPIGTVKNLYLLSPEKVDQLGKKGSLVKVVLMIDRNYDIPEDSLLLLTRTAILGEQELMFVPSESQHFLAKDGTAAVWKTELPPSPTERVSEAVAELKQTFGVMMENVNKIIGDEKFQKDVKETAANLAEMTDKSTRLADDIDKTVKEMNLFAASARKVIEGERMRSILDRTNGFVTKIDNAINDDGLLVKLMKDKELSDNVKDAVTQMKRAMAELQAAIPRAAAAADELRSLSRFLESHPSSVLFGRPQSAPAPYTQPPIDGQ